MLVYLQHVGVASCSVESRFNDVTVLDVTAPHLCLLLLLLYMQLAYN